MPPPPRSTANPAPVRPSGSVRRTSSVDVSWPDGLDGERLFVGAARDLWTPVAGEDGLVLSQGRFEARLTADKTITAIVTEPASAGASALVGARAGGHLRMLLREAMPELASGAHPLYLALDDLSGSALVSAFAPTQWVTPARPRREDGRAKAQDERVKTPPVDVCWGLQPGSSGADSMVSPGDIANADAGDLRNPRDAMGWHAFFEHAGAGFRRARRIDLTRDEAAGVIRIDSAFQDSATRPDGSRLAIHEYLLRATADIATLEVLSIAPEARVLPFPECPGAMANVQRLVGRNLAEIREEVLAQLRGPEGCTHLNDALRALADVPKLMDRIAASPE
jgi:hypothetical protein